MTSRGDHDPVNNPTHYMGGTMQVIDFIESWCLSGHMHNVVKYILRAGKKNSKSEDLRKALWYLNRVIEKDLFQYLVTKQQQGISPHIAREEFGLDNNITFVLEFVLAGLWGQSTYIYAARNELELCIYELDNAPYSSVQVKSVSGGGA